MGTLTMYCGYTRAETRIKFRHPYGDAWEGTVTVELRPSETMDNAYFAEITVLSTPEEHTRTGSRIPDTQGNKVTAVVVGNGKPISKESIMDRANHRHPRCHRAAIYRVPCLLRASRREITATSRGPISRVRIAWPCAQSAGSVSPVSSFR